VSFFILYTVGKTPWTEDQFVARPLPTHRINAYNTDIRSLSGIRTHDPSVRTSEDSSCPRPRGHYDRPVASLSERKMRLPEDDLLLAIGFMQSAAPAAGQPQFTG
jgi:hypothetical protein